MTTSNSTNFSQTTQDIIRMAFFHIGKYGNGRTIQAEDYNIASSVLNAMIKEWQAMGLHLWAKQEGFLFITPYTAEYNLGSYTYFSKKEDTQINQLVVALSSGDTSVTVGSTADMAIDDNIGVVLDTGYIHWSTIASITNSTTLVIDDAMDSDAAINNIVYTFTATAGKPLRIHSARLVQGFDNGADGSSQVEIPLSALAYQDYWNLSSTTLNAAVVSQYNYNPQIDDGTLHLWPRPTTGANRIQITYERMLEDMDALNNTFDFPSEWFSALQYQLAVRLAPGYGKSDKLATLLPMASAMLENVKEWDNEVNSIQLMPVDTGYEW